MNKKHFIALAAAIKEAYTDCTNPEHKQTVAFVAGKVARACADENPRFDDARFLAACGITN